MKPYLGRRIKRSSFRSFPDRTTEEYMLGATRPETENEERANFFIIIIIYYRFRWKGHEFRNRLHYSKKRIFQAGYIFRQTSVDWAGADSSDNIAYEYYGVTVYICIAFYHYFRYPYRGEIFKGFTHCSYSIII